MAKPRSVVVKTNKPTQAQLQAQRDAMDARLYGGPNPGVAQAPPAVRASGPVKATKPGVVANPSGNAVNRLTTNVPTPPKRMPKPKATVVAKQPRVARPVSTPTASPTPSSTPTATPTKPVKVKAPRSTKPAATGATTAVPDTAAYDPVATVKALFDQQQTTLANQQTQAREVLQQATDAYMKYVLGIPQQIQGYYNQGISDQEAAAKAAGASLAAANPNPQLQADLQAIGAPESQQASTTAANQTAFGGNGALLNFTGGTLPANQARADRTAALSYAAMLPAIAGASGLQALGRYNTTADTANQKLAADRLAALVNAQNQAATQSQQKRHVDLEYYLAGLKGQNQAFQQNATKTRLKISAQNSEIAKLRADRSWQATLSSLKIRSAAERRHQAELEIKLRSGGFTTAQVQKFHGTAATIAQNAYQGFTDAKGNYHPPLAWGNALYEMRKAGIPARIALQEATFWFEPGERGRPKATPTKPPSAKKRR